MSEGDIMESEDTLSHVIKQSRKQCEARDFFPKQICPYILKLHHIVVSTFARNVTWQRGSAFL